MKTPSPIHAFRVLTAGLQSSFQDHGRPGMKRWGVPPGGVMDQSAVAQANRLLDQAAHTPVLEILFGGIELECLHDSWIVISGQAPAFLNDRPIATARTTYCRNGDVLRIPMQAKTLWTYIATEGGWHSKSWLGSQSVWQTGGMGRTLQAGDIITRNVSTFALPAGISARYQQPVAFSTDAIKVWPGPQWQKFSDAARQQFFTQSWTISPKSNRAGYRLVGPKIETNIEQMISEPTRMGSVQIPSDGQPIVLLNDGPTMGGYPKIAQIDASEFDRFRQTFPCASVTFTLLS